MRTSDAILTDDERDKLRAVVLADGLPTVARWLGLGRDTVGRLVAGLPVRSGSVLIVRVRLAQNPPTTTEAPPTP